MKARERMRRLKNTSDIGLLMSEMTSQNLRETMRLGKTIERLKDVALAAGLVALAAVAVKFFG